jgi:hypothetical protein
MRSKRMTAKHPGTCTNCHEPIRPGQTIYWQRGAGAHHENCRSAGLAESAYRSQQEHLYGDHPCWTCDSPHGRFRSYGASTPVYCDACDQEHRAHHDGLGGAANSPDATDIAYEDDCARRCGL